MPSDIQNPIFTDEEAARAHFERVRWPNGPVCPHCGATERLAKREGPNYRPGVYDCPHCRRQFTATIGTLFERSHIPLNKWFLAMHLLGSSKKGMSAHQLHRMLGIAYRSAWFMAHRIREAMAGKAPVGGLGGEGKVVEADETYFGKLDTPRPRANHKGPPTKGGRSGPANKRAVVGLVERGGHVRTFHVDRADADTVKAILRTNASRASRLMTDESRLYVRVGEEFASHRTVTHAAGEYVNKDDRSIHTNTIEGYFSVFKRGMKGTYQHCGEQHLHRYLAEFDFRYNTRTALGFTDRDRAELLAAAVVGKRLTYRRPRVAVAA
jgi:transposase-like protein